MSGLFSDDTLSLYLKLKEAMKQYVRDAMPGGLLNPEVKPQDTLDAAALSLTPVPVVGDIAGLLADGYRYATDPSSRTPLNYGLSALGALPFVPAMGGMTKLGKTAPEPPRAEAMRVAQANAAKPVSEGGLGLRPDNTPMERARAMGFIDDVYHGSKTPEGITELIPGGRNGAIQTGDAYGTGVYTSTDKIGDANSYGAQGAVFPLKINRSNYLNVDHPSSDDLEKLSKLAGEVMLPSDKARFSIGREVMHFANDAEAEEFWRTQKENWKQFGDGMERAKPKADFLKDGGVNVEFTNFDAPVPIRSAEDANTLLKAIGWDNVQAMGYEGHTLDRGNGRFWDVTNNPANLRSRFAAFDPARRHEADLLGAIDPQLLPWLAGSGLLGAYGVSQLEDK